MVCPTWKYYANNSLGIMPNHNGRSAALWADGHVDLNHAAEFKIRTNVAALNTNHRIFINKEDPTPVPIKDL